IIIGIVDPKSTEEREELALEVTKQLARAVIHLDGHEEFQELRGAANAEEQRTLFVFADFEARGQNVAEAESAERQQTQALDQHSRIVAGDADALFRLRIKNVEIAVHQGAQPKEGRTRDEEVFALRQPAGLPGASLRFLGRTNDLQIVV